MNFKKHLKNRIIVNFLFLAPLFFAACGKEEVEQKFVAKVNDATLSEKDLNEALAGFRNGMKYREEYINEWVEKEMLYQEAESQGLIESDEFRKTVQQSRMELAKALLITRMLSENSIVPEQNELKDYFEKFKEDFRLNDAAFRVNVIKFNSEDKAVQFRSTAVESDWARTLNVFRGDASIVGTENNQLLMKHDISDLNLLRIVNYLNSDEISIVFKTEPSVFEVVQLVEKFDQGYLPAFEDVETLVKERYIHFKQLELYRNYINSLVSKYNLVIKKENE